MTTNRDLRDYTQRTRIPERYKLTHTEMQTLSNIAAGNGINDALSLTYRAGFEAGQRCSAATQPEDIFTRLHAAAGMLSLLWEATDTGRRDALNDSVYGIMQLLDGAIADLEAAQ